MKRYQQIVKQGSSLGAYDGDELVGLAIAESREWNRSLWVWELGVDREHRRSGIGTKIVEALVHVAKHLNLRIIVCETQNTNVPAIEFYRATGFEMGGIDEGITARQGQRRCYVPRRHIRQQAEDAALGHLRHPFDDR